MVGEYVIETNRLSKAFVATDQWRFWRHRPPQLSVADVSLQVAAGEIFGLLGPNGAGKTTLTKMLCTLIRPTSGEATIAGYSLSEGQEIRATVGLVVTDERSFYWRISGRRNLRFFAALQGLKGRAAESRIDQLLDQVDLVTVADRPFQQYSSGMKQRLAIARGMLHQPRLLFLDEPSRSLDPVATDRLHRLIQALNGQGLTIFLITHDLSEAEKLCNRVAVMDAGRIQAVGPAQSLRQQLDRRWRYRLFVPPIPAETHRALLKLDPDMEIASLGAHVELHFFAAETDGRLAAILDQLHRDSISVTMIEGVPPSLEEVFQHFTRPSDEL